MRPGRDNTCLLYRTYVLDYCQDEREVEVRVQWLELLVLSEAACDLVLASLNCVYFGRYASRTRPQSRRVAALALVIVNAGLALESAMYLLVATPVAGRPLTVAAELLVRSTLLAAAGFISLLIVRAPAPRH